MIELVIVSGKGGVGKTTISSSLAFLAGRKGYSVVAVDADVDAPNLSLLLGGELVKEKRLSVSEKARIVQDLCEKCGKCYEACVFGSIEKLDGGYVVASIHCEGCGVCEAVCPAGAVKIEPVENGRISIFRSRFGFPLVVGQMDVGESGSGKIVSEVKEEARRVASQVKASLLIVDGPPGAGCSAISAISGASHVLLVTEPTKAAKHDLERVLSIVNHFGVPFGAVVNRFDAYPEMASEISRLIEDEGGEVLALIPSDEEVVHSIVNGQPVVERSPSSPASKAIEEAFRRVEELLKGGIL
ncbi:MAG: nucleotide-binding protein [Candidatus Freyarchaeota archaeon]